MYPPPNPFHAPLPSSPLPSLLPFFLPSLPLLFPFLLVLLSSVPATSAACSQILASTDVEALENARKYVLNGETNLPGDLSQSCCLQMVTCNETGGVYRVVNGNLAGLGLAGSLPPSLGNLTALVSMNLSGNFIQGPIPDAWSSLKNLKELSLAENQLSGSLPSFIGELSITKLDLRNNTFSGYLPASIFSANLTSCDSYLPGNPRLNVVCKNGIISNAPFPPPMPPSPNPPVSPPPPPPPSAASGRAWPWLLTVVAMGVIAVLL